MLINTGMLPHQFSAFCEGLFGPLHSEFERTPKAATVTASSSSGVAAGAAVAAGPAPGTRNTVEVHGPYVLAEVFFVAYQLAWAVLFAREGRLVWALGAALMGASVLALLLLYGDHDGKVCFVVDTTRLRRLRPGVR